MDEKEYREALRREQARLALNRRDDALIHEANLNRINQDYKSGGGHGGAIAGVVILLVLGIAAWAYLG